MKNNRPQVVITGASLVTALGLSRTQTWQNIRAGRCGMHEMSAMESPLPPGKDGGQALDLPSDFYPDDPREVRYLRWTIRDALREAGALDSLPYDSARCAFMIGTTLHGMRAAGRMLRSGDYGALRDFLAGNTLHRATSDLNFHGSSATTCSACSSSLGSIALAVTMLQNGQADLIVAGGYDTISEYVYGGFNSLRLVASGPLRPFAKNREGMKLAEGYGIVVLERLEDALNRSATPQAAIVGCGESADAHHLTQPHPEGEGAARAMSAALGDANLSPDQIQLIAAHATGTPDNDAGEYAAMSRVFGAKLPQAPVVAFKSHLGHTLGAAGAVELILASMAIADQTVPGCVNVAREDVEFEKLNLSTQPHPAEIRATLNTSLGFGGANTCIVLGRAGKSGNTGVAPTRAVFITGIGVVLPGAVGNEAFLRHLTSESAPAWTQASHAVDESEIAPLLNARRIRRMSDYVKLTLAATSLALRDAGIDDIPVFAETCSAILGTTHGSSNYSGTYYEQIVQQGIIGANPMLFAEGVPNAAAAHLSLMLSLRGACQTVIGTRTAGLDAIRLASLRIASGQWERAIVSAGEENYERVIEAYRHAGIAVRETGSAPFSSQSGFVSGSGAVALILESAESIQKRNGKWIGRIDATASSRGDANGVDAISRVIEQVGETSHIITSANSTWIDRAELVALRRAQKSKTISTMYGHIAETFSATPLAAIAAGLLSGHLPRLLGRLDARRNLIPANGSRVTNDFTTICTDYTGLASAVRVIARGDAD